MPPNSEGDEHLLELVRSELCWPIGSGALRGGVSRIHHDDYQSDNQEDRDDKHQQ